MSSPIELLPVLDKAGNQLVWFDNMTAPTTQVGELAGFLDVFREGSLDHKLFVVSKRLATVDPL